VIILYGLFLSYKIFKQFTSFSKEVFKDFLIPRKFSYFTIYGGEYVEHKNKGFMLVSNNIIMTAVDEWSEKSKLEIICNVLGCQNKPSAQCPTCSHYYCYEDILNHRHIISKEEEGEQTRRDEKIR
jgi:hypothetical protein